MFIRIKADASCATYRRASALNLEMKKSVGRGNGHAVPGSQVNEKMRLFLFNGFSFYRAGVSSPSIDWRAILKISILLPNV